MSNLQFTFLRAAPVVIEKEVVDDADNGAGMLDVLVSNVWSRGAGVDGLTLTSTVDKDSSVDIDSVEKLMTCVKYFFRKGTIAGLLKPPVLVKALGKGRGSVGQASAAVGTAHSTATALTADPEAARRWETMKDAVMMWTEGMRSKVAGMADAHTQGKKVQALVNLALPDDEKVWVGSILTKTQADALGKAAHGVRLLSPTNNVIANWGPLPPRQGHGIACHRLSV